MDRDTRARDTNSGAGPDGVNDTERPRLNIAGLLWSLIFGVFAAVGFTGSFDWVFDDATKWIAAGMVALIGLALLITALPRRSGD